MEVVVSGRDYPAELAERCGYINRAIQPEELTPFIDALAYQITSYPLESIALAKKAVVLALVNSIVEGLIEETHLFNQSCALSAAKERMAMFLQLGGQTRDGELDIIKVVDEYTRKIGDK